MSNQLVPLSRHGLIELEALFEQFQHFHQQYIFREGNVSTSFSSPVSSPVFPASPSFSSWKKLEKKDEEKKENVENLKHWEGKAVLANLDADKATDLCLAREQPPSTSSSPATGTISGRGDAVDGATHRWRIAPTSSTPSLYAFPFGQEEDFCSPLSSPNRRDSNRGFFPFAYHSLLLSGQHPLLLGSFLDVMTDPYVSLRWRLDDKLLYMLWWSFRPPRCMDCGMQELWLPSRDGEYACAHCGVMAGSTKKSKIVEDSSAKFVGSGPGGGSVVGGASGGFHVSGKGGSSGENNDNSDDDEDEVEVWDGVMEKTAGMEEGETQIRHVYSQLFRWLQRIPVLKNASFASALPSDTVGENNAMQARCPFLHAPLSSLSSSLWQLPSGEDIPSVLRVAYELTMLFSMPTSFAGSDAVSLSSLRSYHLRGATSTGANKTAAFTSNAFVARGAGLYLSLLLHRYVIPFSFFVRGGGTSSCITSVNVEGKDVTSHLPPSSRVEESYHFPSTSFSSPTCTVPPSSRAESSSGAVTLEWVDIEFAAMLAGIPLLDFFGEPLAFSFYSGPSTSCATPIDSPSALLSLPKDNSSLLSSDISSLESVLAKKAEENSAEGCSSFVFPPLHVEDQPSTANTMLSSSHQVFPSAAAQYFEHVASICVALHYHLPSLLWNSFSILPSFFEEVIEGVKQSRRDRHPMLPRPLMVNLTHVNEQEDAVNPEEASPDVAWGGLHKLAGRSSSFASFPCTAPVSTTATTMLSLAPECIAMGAMMALAAEIDRYSMWSLGVRWVVENANVKKGEGSPVPFSSVMPSFTSSTATATSGLPMPSLRKSPSLSRTEGEGRKSGNSPSSRTSEKQKEEYNEKWLGEMEAYVLQDDVLTQKAWEVAEHFGTQLAHWYRECRTDGPLYGNAMSDSTSGKNCDGEIHLEDGKKKRITHSLYPLDALLYSSLEDFEGDREAWRETLKIPAVKRFEAWQLHLQSNTKSPTPKEFPSSVFSTPVVEEILFTDSPSANGLVYIFTILLGLPYHPLFLADQCIRTALFTGAHRCGEVLQKAAKEGHYDTLPLARRLSPLVSMWLSPYFALHSIDRLPFLSSLRLLHHSLHVSGKAQNVILQQLQRILAKYGGVTYYQFYFVIRVTDPKEKIFNGFYFLSAVYGSHVGIAVFTCLRSGRKTITFNGYNKRISLCHYDERDLYPLGMSHSSSSSHGNQSGYSERTLRSLQLHLIEGSVPVVAGIDSPVTALLHDVAKGDEMSRSKFYAWEAVVKGMEMLSHLRRRLRAVYDSRVLTGENDEQGERREITMEDRYLNELAAWCSKVDGGGGSLASSSSMLDMSTPAFQGGRGGFVNGDGTRPPASSGSGGGWGMTVDDLRNAAPFHLGSCREVIQRELLALRQNPSFLAGLPDERVVVLYTLVVAFLEFITAKQAALCREQSHHRAENEKERDFTGGKDDVRESKTGGRSSSLSSTFSKRNETLHHSSYHASVPSSQVEAPPIQDAPLLSQETARESRPTTASHPRHRGGSRGGRGRKSSKEVVAIQGEANRSHRKEGMTEGVAIPEEGGIAEATLLNWVEELWWKEEDDDEDEDEEEEDESEGEGDGIAVGKGRDKKKKKKKISPRIDEGVVPNFTRESPGGENSAIHLGCGMGKSFLSRSPPSSFPLKKRPPPNPSTVSSRRPPRVMLTPVMQPHTPPVDIKRARPLPSPPFSLGPSTVGDSTVPSLRAGGRGGGGRVTGVEDRLQIGNGRKSSPAREGEGLTAKNVQPARPPQHVSGQEKARKMVSASSFTATSTSTNTKELYYEPLPSVSMVEVRRHEEALRQCIRQEYLSSIPTFNEVLEQSHDVISSRMHFLMQKLRKAVKKSRSVLDDGEEKHGNKGKVEERKQGGSISSSSSCCSLNSPTRSCGHTPTMLAMKGKDASSSTAVPSGDATLPPSHPSPPSPSTAPHGGALVSGSTGFDGKNSWMEYRELHFTAFSLLDAPVCRARLRQLLYFLDAYEELEWEVECVLSALVKRFLIAYGKQRSGFSSHPKQKGKKSPPHVTVGQSNRFSFSSSVHSHTPPSKGERSRREHTPRISSQLDVGECRKREENNVYDKEESSDIEKPHDSNHDNDEEEKNYFPPLAPLLLPPSTKVMEWRTSPKREVPSIRGGSTSRNGSITRSESSSSSEEEEKSASSSLMPGKSTESTRLKRSTGRKRRRQWQST